jgi:hypothetical protein
MLWSPLRAHRVGLLADIFRNALAPGIAIDAAAHRQDGLRRGPFAFEPQPDLIDIEFLEVDHDRRDIGLRSEAANVGVPHHRLGAALFRDLQVTGLVHNAEQQVAAIVEQCAAGLGRGLRIEPGIDGNDLHSCVGVDAACAHQK